MQCQHVAGGAGPDWALHGAASAPWAAVHFEAPALRALVCFDWPPRPARPRELVSVGREIGRVWSARRRRAVKAYLVQYPRNSWHMTGSYLHLGGDRPLLHAEAVQCSAAGCGFWTRGLAAE